MANYLKSKLIKDVAEASGFSTANVQEVLDLIIAQIKTRTEAGDVVNIAPLGSFRQSTRKAREGRNPATGEALQIPEKQVLSFKPSKSKT